ncbi:Cupin domain-containing protein [Filimonas lacunae]|uniref:Cupin domain-containing protein n=1 Tax=Filimonas lacunae TaxID=477680 RepID=A0A1N7R0U2_9BACT|nr:cupin domain-containing protein [Filimonas lacunae]SIT28644.1 Cupin domain-containing protein [Filimonas lacunae]
MERKSFLKSCFTIGAIAATPFQLIAKGFSRLRVNNGFMVAAGKTRSEKAITLLEGDTFFSKISSKDTDGDIYVFESSRVKEGGPAHHLHFSQDEWWYVLQGEFLIKVGETTYHAKAGDSVFGPRMIPHSFAKIGETEGKLLMIFQPAGKMEEFFNKVSQGVAKNMTEDQQDKFREEHGFKRVGPPIDHYKKM